MDEIKKERILRNLDDWTFKLTQLNKKQDLIKPNVNKTTLNKIKTKLKFPLRYETSFSTYDKNSKFAYTIAFILVSRGLPPSKINIVDLNDCYQHIRGYGVESQKFLKNLFDNNKKVIILENVHPQRTIDNIDNVESFWLELISFLEKNKNISCILTKDSNFKNIVSNELINKKIKKIFEIKQ